MKMSKKTLMEEARVPENPLPKNLWTIVQEFENVYYVYCIISAKSVALNS